MSGISPIQIFQDNATQERAENARLSSFVGAIAVGDLVKSTLGPKGMDKILQSLSTGEIMVTNDGATILKSIALDNAAAKILVNISKVQDDEVGDGTTSVCVLAAELLREGERLVNQKIHPQTIIEGYRLASQAAFNALEASAVDHSSNKVAFRQDLVNIAKTTLSSKVLSQDKNYFAELAVDAVLRLKGSTNLDNIQIIKKPGGRLQDSYLDEGFILDKKFGVNQPKRIENAKILVANTPMDTDKIKIFGARVRVDATGKLAELERAERNKMKEKVEKIKAHGVNCFVNRQLIYNWPEQLFADAGMMSIEHADFDGVERLALVTGGEIASTFDHPELVKLGYCDLIEEIMIGEDRLIKFSGVAAGEACTIVLRGSTTQLLDEAERSLHDALCVLSQTVSEPRTLLGGGCAEMLMARAVDEVAAITPGKQSIACESFAKALRQLPMILADNAGFDSSDLVAKLRAAHYEGKSTFGLDMYNGEIADMRELGITESFKLKRQVLLSASEATEMILRVDDIIRCAPRQRERDFVHHYRCFSISTALPDKLQLNYGGKIMLPPSALAKLSSINIQLPMQFKIASIKNTNVTHAGVLEFIAEEGRCYLPNWTMQTLGLADGDLVVITSASLPLGKFVKIQPQHTDFLQISDPKAVLENAFRSFSTLTKGDIIAIQYNSKLYNILVLETKPVEPAISIIETDLEVDFAAPLGYVEPIRTPVPSSQASLLGGTTETLKEHTVIDDADFKPFVGSGKKLNGKDILNESNADDALLLGNSNAALRLPDGFIFLGYKIVPLKSDEDSKTEDVSAYAD